VSLAVLGLIALGAVTHATWNLAVKRSGAGGPAFVWLTAIAAAVLLLPFGLWFAIRSDVPIGTILTACLVSSILHIGYFLLLQRGYQVGDVSVVYPLARGSGPLLSVVLAIVLLGERPAPIGIVGAAVVIAGVVVIGLAGGRHGFRHARAGVLFGLLTGVLIAGYTLWDAHAVTAWAVAPVALSWGTAVGQTLLLAPVVLARPAPLLDVLKRHWRVAILVGVLSEISYIAILFAFQLAPVALVAPGREVSVVLVGLAGWLLFKEPHPVQRLIGAAIVLTGVVLLALS
jgi:drug/metabolite transporter (DMT)-like permease